MVKLLAALVSLPSACVGAKIKHNNSRSEVSRCSGSVTGRWHCFCWLHMLLKYGSFSHGERSFSYICCVLLCCRESFYRSYQMEWYNYGPTAFPAVCFLPELCVKLVLFTSNKAPPFSSRHASKHAHIHIICMRYNTHWWQLGKSS